MTKEDLFRAIGSVDDQQVLEAETPKGRLRLWPRAAALAACLALIATAALTLPRQADNTADAGAENSDLDGSEYSASDDRPGDMIHDPDIGGPAAYSKNVDIGQLDGPPPAADVEGDISSACLVWLEPEEIFAMDTAIFRGTVTDLQYYEATGGYRAYFTVAAVEVTDPIRGDVEAGGTCRVYLPCAPGMSVSTAGALEELEIGSEAIFMPGIATADTGVASGDSYFCYADVADFWFSEGVRFLFLETEEGLRYASDVYDLGVAPSEATLEDAAAYIRSMLSRSGDGAEPVEAGETDAAAARPAAQEAASPQGEGVTGEIAVDRGEWRPREDWGQELPNAEPRWDDSGALAEGRQAEAGLCGYPRAEDFSPAPADFRS